MSSRIYDEARRLALMEPSKENIALFSREAMRAGRLTPLRSFYGRNTLSYVDEAARALLFAEFIDAEDYSFDDSVRRLIFPEIFWFSNANTIMGRCVAGGLDRDSAKKITLAFNEKFPIFAVNFEGLSLENMFDPVSYFKKKRIEIHSSPGFLTVYRSRSYSYFIIYVSKSGCVSARMISCYALLNDDSSFNRYQVADLEFYEGNISICHIRSFLKDKSLNIGDLIRFKKVIRDSPVKFIEFLRFIIEDESLEYGFYDDSYYNTDPDSFFCLNRLEAAMDARGFLKGEQNERKIP